MMHQAFKKPPSFENRGTTGVCLGHDSRIAGGVLVLGLFPNFPNFPNFPFFPFVPFFLVFFVPFFSVFRGFRISAFSVFWVGAFQRKPSPSPEFIFLPPVPSQTQSHSPKTAKCSGKCNHAINCCCRWFPPPPPSFPSMSTQMCCVSEAKRTPWPKDGGAESNTACRTGMHTQT